jgi:flagellar biogenesis protein FliO
MDASLWRLTWALPLVLALGVLAVLALRRFGARGRASSQPSRLSLGATLVLSDSTRAHCMDLDGRTFLVVESTSSVALERAVPTTASTNRQRRGWLGDRR